jgi:biotin synthase
MFEKGAGLGNFEFEEGRLDRIVGIPDLVSVGESEEPYLTTGCPDCSRPFYTERVHGPLYNIPALHAGGSP